MTTSPPSHANTITQNNNNDAAILDMEPPPTTTSGTTFIQAGPSNFRAVVQKLTGVSRDSSSKHKLPVTYLTPESVGSRIPPFKLQERKQSKKKLDINLEIVPGVEHPNSVPVSTQDLMMAHRMMISPRTAMRMEELEKRGIAEKGYYLHPTPPGCRGSEPPELLPLFPLHHSSST